MLYKQDELAQALGISSSTPAVSGVSIDSRSAEKGDLFFALKGPKFDGIDFLEQAFARGVAYAIIAGEYKKQQKIDGARVLKVDDTLKTLTRLASYARSRTSARIIAITGSVGKTSLRALLQNILPGAVAASLGNLNNHIGVPLSLARMPRESQYGVFELGMSKQGEIANLSAIVRPHFAIITAIAPAHLMFFESEDEICDAKAEIFANVSQCALFPANEKYRERLYAHAVNVPKVATFGSDEKSNYRLCQYTTRNDSTEVRAIFPSKSKGSKQEEQHQEEKGIEHQWRIGGYGAARVLGSLGALAICNELNLDVASIAKKLQNQFPLQGRGAISEINLASPAKSFHRRIRVIDESYNSSPVALRTALATLASLNPRRIAALGDMLELGKHEIEMHSELAADAARSCDAVFTCGNLMQKLYRNLPRSKRGAHRDEAQELAKPLLAHLKHGDTLLVKGSLGSGMQILLEELNQHATA